MENFYIACAQIIPALMLGVILETRYIMKSDLWKSQKVGYLRRTQSGLWILSLILLWRTQIQIVDGLSGNHSFPNTETVSEAISLAIFSICFTPIVEVFVRSFNYLFAYFSVETPIFYYSFLNFLWKKDKSISKYFIQRRNRKSLKRIEILRERICVLQKESSGYDVEFLSELISNLDEAEKSELETKHQLDSGMRFNEEMFDKNSRRKRIELLSKQLLG